MEKMREEFEVWVVSALGCDVADTSKDEYGVYNSFQTGNLYVAWVASRKAMRIELPDSKDDHQTSSYFVDGSSNGFNACLEEVKCILDDAGVRYE